MGVGGTYVFQLVVVCIWDGVESMVLKLARFRDGVFRQ